MEPTFAIRWLYNNIAHKEVVAGKETCAACGLPTENGLPQAQVFRKTFTDGAALRRPENDCVCSACAWYFDNQSIRRTGWFIAENEARAVDKKDWLALIQSLMHAGEIAPCYLLIKPIGLVGKHLALYAPLNLDPEPLFVRYNIHTLKLDEHWLEAAQTAFALREKHAWAEIKNDDYNSKTLAEKWENLSMFETMRCTIHPYLFTPYFELIMFLWTQPEKER